MPKSSLKPKLERILDTTREINITVTGRKSRRKITLPVWFVHQPSTLVLMPVTGERTNWYRNLTKNPWIEVDAGTEKVIGRAVLSREPGKVRKVAEMFRTKYGTSDVKRYYPKIDACVEIPLAESEEDEVEA